MPTRNRQPEAIQRHSDAEPAIADSERAEPQPLIKGTIEFRHLTFAYNGKPVLHDIDLKIESGKTVAFVGKTAAENQPY